MRLTKEQAIFEHRKMWNWIADKTLERKTCVKKADYFKENGIIDEPCCQCYCCEYDEKGKYYKRCYRCPLEWNSRVSTLKCFDNKQQYDDHGLFAKYLSHNRRNDYKMAAKLARRIANLPERKFKRNKKTDKQFL